MSEENTQEIGSTDDKGLMSESDVAEVFRITPRTLRAWRRRGYGPAHVHVGKFIRYWPAEVERFIADLPPGPNGAREDHAGVSQSTGI